MVRSDAVTRALLNEVKDDPGAAFVHRADTSKPQSAVVFGRVRSSINGRN